MAIKTGRPNVVKNVRNAVIAEQEGLKVLLKAIDESEVDLICAVDTITSTTGKVVVTGVGKSGIVGMKIAASLASTGTTAIFMHPSEGFHGDLGMVSGNDVILALSNSGESAEVLQLLPFFESNGNKIISITRDKDSTLARAADYPLVTGIAPEACPHQLAPTTSTTVAMALGDALVVALIEENNFQPIDFAKFHPGGSLGKKLYQSVADVMITENLPVIDVKAPNNKGYIDIIENHGHGIAILTDGGVLHGVLTDGDIRKWLNENIGWAKKDVKPYISTNPVTISSDESFAQALCVMDENKITTLVVVSDDNRVIGIVKK